METTKRRSIPADVPAERDAYGLADFCARHSISLATFYRLVEQDSAPDIFHVGSRVLVSREAAAAWRREREEATAAEADATAAARKAATATAAETETT